MLAQTLPQTPPHGTVVSEGMQSSLSFTVPSTPAPNWFSMFPPLTFWCFGCPGTSFA